MAKKARKLEKRFVWKKALSDLEDFFNVYLVERAPALPMGLKKFMVIVWPYLILVGLVVSFPFVLMTLRLQFIVPSFLVDRTIDFHFTFLRLVNLVIFVIQIAALPGLFRREENGWRLAYYTVLMNAVVTFFTAGIFGFLLGTLISLYLIFQIKEFYSK